ncbi:TPR-like protein [Lindgomyces ingoldianus]|uniref:TPR-like protein n=1 Tax=Lindgomyces ingoldianus TaxID=673940 RepID=A0ACB6QBH7_9PLEO|nr:TPR-like protein [Lindgomyces ingoldianus]KAF2464329.1 TPR-like protein [Lindgomyces ingoldianus]
MSPSPPGVAAQLRQLIHYHLDNGFLENALFLAGRLHGLEPRSPDAAHLLALCNLRLGRYKAAYDSSRPKGCQGQHLGCAYVFAQACLGLERFVDGAFALEKARGLWAGRNHWNKHSETSRRHLPDAAACYCLLGKLWNTHGDTKKAVDYYIEALKLNPFMWDAFTDLCDIGALVRPMNIFKVTPEMLAALSHSASTGSVASLFMSQESFEAKNPFILTPEIDPFNPSRNGGDVGLNLGGSNLLSKLNGSIPVSNGSVAGSGYPDVETPTSNGQNMHDGDVMMGDVGGPVLHEQGVDVPHAPGKKSRLQPFSAMEEPPKMRPITSRSRLKMGSEGMEATEIPRPIGQNGHKRTVSGHSTHANVSSLDPTAAPPRRSVRLLNSISSQIRPSSSRLAAVAGRDPEGKERREMRKAKATGTKGKAGTMSTVGRVVSGNRKPTVEISEASSKPESRPASGASGALAPPKMIPTSDPGRDQEALHWLLDLLLKIGTGYAQLSRFQCVQALETFATVPTQQRETPWVLAQIGKAYYERSMYSDAEKVFQRIREKAPSHMEDMEVFSNVLWQLKRETDLAYLAHTLVDQDRLSPQAWCALGNAFSLQREHDQAIKCFTRATQLDPKFAYAFTLQGHEHVTNEEFDKALNAYRCAISADNRHYNGWYGLGQVFEKMGKYDHAETHYRAASKINPTNALLAVKIGSVLDRMKKTQPALMQYMTAVALDPRSNLARFRKAQIHLKLGAPVEALKDLEYLKDSAPDDANVHFLLGRTYKKLRDRTNAIRHFTIAMNLDPKASQYIKEAMEGLDDDEVGEWSSGDER